MTKFSAQNILFTSIRPFYFNSTTALCNQKPAMPVRKYTLAAPSMQSRSLKGVPGAVGSLAGPMRRHGCRWLRQQIRGDLLRHHLPRHPKTAYLLTANTLPACSRLRWKTKRILMMKCRAARPSVWILTTYHQIYC
ncbi:hypothetical protein CDEST_15395 [Colletotrichum destructivum]|uniref:Uncharacterized protein n=1 Tax=Colletotrichum destructivum TaxID=34406 RepID=A0AAX4J4T3_9PEZI|nr:hypothetical protein CDEST_15395 [Colletotrichum destructivum]